MKDMFDNFKFDFIHITTKLRKKKININTF